MFNMFKKKNVKKSKDMPENNNSSSGEELSDDELFNVAGGSYIDLTRRNDLSQKEKERLFDLFDKAKHAGANHLPPEEQKEYSSLLNRWGGGCVKNMF